MYIEYIQFQRNENCSYEASAADVIHDKHCMNKIPGDSRSNFKKICFYKLNFGGFSYSSTIKSS